MAGYTAPADDLRTYQSKGTNPLDDYASYNCLFTLACLSQTQQSSRNINPSSITNIIASSKGDWGKNASKRVVTEFGSFDYFIDDLLIVSTPSLSQQTGNSFATKISFKVTEPYSMALFYLTMQTGALACGYQNYREAPYLLMIEFIGYDNSRKPKLNPSLTRYIPIRFIKSKMKVTSSGSIYECECVPYNEVLFRDEMTNITTDTIIKGSDVKNILTAGTDDSLETKLKVHFQEDLKDKYSDVTDHVEIHFPKDFTDPSNSGNEISRSGIFKDLTDAGTVKFPNQDKIYNSFSNIYMNSKVTLDKDKNFHFSQNTKIQDIITAIVLRSDYIAKQLTNANALVNAKGMVNWFRVEANIFDGKHSEKLNRQTRRMVYRVIPYEVHVSKLIPPDTIPPGYGELKKKVIRVYDYIYTGNNSEIQNLELDFNQSFFSSLPADASNRTGSNTPGNTLDASPDPDKTFRTGNNPNSPKEIPNTAGAVAAPGTADGSDPSGSGNPQSVQVRTLQALLTNPADLVKITITILGDPYYVPSSGMGNQIVEPKGDNILADGSMNYQNGEIDIVVNFRTPVDLDPVTGLYRFITTADQFSGLYFITKIESKFNQNKFTQVISATRRRAQLEGAPQNFSLFE